MSQSGERRKAQVGRTHGEIEIGIIARIWKADMKEFSLDSRKKR